MTTRATQIADAMVAIAHADHYMVGLVETVTIQEIRDAMQILINRQNDTVTDSEEWETLNLAIDLLELEEMPFIKG